MLKKPIITKEELLAWQGWRTMSECARILKTPRRTYVGWIRGESRIPGAVAAFIERDYSRFDTAQHKRELPPPKGGSF